MMQTFMVLAAFTFALPSVVVSQPVVRNVYSEASYLGAKTFLTYVEKAGLATLLKDPRENLTAFAPTDVAFNQLGSGVRSRMDTDANFLKEMIDFHLVRGYQTIQTDHAVFRTLAENDMGRVDVYTNPNMTTISGSPVLLSGNLATNGEVVILSRVMYPLPAGYGLSYIRGADNFSMLSLAFTKAGINSLLNVADITVFAPTNQAFQRLPPGVFPDLLDDIPLLTKVLQNHVVNDVIYSAYVKKTVGNIVLNTFNGQPLNVTAVANGTLLQVGRGAMVTSSDVNVNNGVIHFIDSVLLPPNLHRSLGKPSFRVV